MSALQAALAANSRTDPATLERVLASLRGQLGGVLPPPLPEPAAGPTGLPDRRTFTPLRNVRGAAW